MATNYVDHDLMGRVSVSGGVSRRKFCYQSGYLVLFYRKSRMARAERIYFHCYRRSRMAHARSEGGTDTQTDGYYALMTW